MQIYEKFINDYQEKGPESFSMDKIFEVQGQAGFFDENLIWADFEKLQEIQLTDFLVASQIDNRPKDEDDDDSGEKEEAGVGYDPVGVYADLIKKENNVDDKKKLANILFKILSRLLHRVILGTVSPVNSDAFPAFGAFFQKLKKIKQKFS